VETSRPYSNTEQIHCEAGREKLTLRQRAKGLRGLEHQKAFDDLRQYLQHLPTLSSLEQGQPHILYVTATHSVVSGALLKEKEAAWLGAAAK
jgi:hypothetical protein